MLLLTLHPHRRYFSEIEQAVICLCLAKIPQCSDYFLFQFLFQVSRKMYNLRPTMVAKLINSASQENRPKRWKKLLKWYATEYPLYANENVWTAQKDEQAKR